MNINRDNITIETINFVKGLDRPGGRFSKLNELQQRYVILYCTAPPSEPQTKTTLMAGYSAGTRGTLYSKNLQVAIKEIGHAIGENDFARAATVQALIISRIADEINAGRSPSTLTRVETEMLENYTSRAHGPVPRASTAAAMTDSRQSPAIAFQSIYKLELHLQNSKIPPGQPTLYDNSLDSINADNPRREKGTIGEKSSILPLAIKYTDVIQNRDALIHQDSVIQNSQGIQRGTNDTNQQQIDQEHEKGHGYSRLTSATSRSCSLSRQAQTIPTSPTLETPQPETSALTGIDRLLSDLASK